MGGGVEAALVDDRDEGLQLRDAGGVLPIDTHEGHLNDLKAVHVDFTVPRALRSNP
jgi:hypothetical protein